MLLDSRRAALDLKHRDALAKAWPIKRLTVHRRANDHA